MMERINDTKVFRQCGFCDGVRLPCWHCGDTGYIELPEFSYEVRELVENMQSEARYWREELFDPDREDALIGLFDKLDQLQALLAARFK